MGRERDSLTVGRVIGDVLDPFNRLDLVSYNSREVTNRCEFKTSAVVNQLRVSIGGNDPRVTLRMVTDIPATTGKYLAKRLSATSTRGQWSGSTASSKLGRRTVFAPCWRQNFRTREFAEQYNLGLPVAAVYFNC